MSDYSKFVESTVSIKAIKSAVEDQHTHNDLDLLNSLKSDGSPNYYLGEDGKYHEIEAGFSTEAFISDYNQTKGNVEAKIDDNGKLYLTASIDFASGLDGSVVGSIEIEAEPTSDKQLNISIADVNVVSGEVTENPIQYLLVGQGLTTGFENGVISINLNSLEAPFIDFMKRQGGVEAGVIGVFDSTGNIVDGSVKLKDLATLTDLNGHIANSDLHVTKSLQDEWSAKQSALTPTQMSAVNSGITAVKVGQYDGYSTSKLSVGGHESLKAVVTDVAGNITTEDKFDPSTKMDVVSNAVQRRVAIFNNAGQVIDSGIILGQFDSNKTVREYIDEAVYISISSSSYIGTFTLLGTKEQVESYTSEKGMNAIIYSGELDNLQGLQFGYYDGSAWGFHALQPAPRNGAWMEFKYLLTETPPVQGSAIIKMNGVANAALDVRPQSSFVLDNNTISYDSQGEVSFKMRTLESGKSVLNTANADSLVYEFTTDENGTDTSRTIKEFVDETRTLFEPKFTKGTAFNKNFDTSTQSGTSTMVIGDMDLRLTNARPASDVPDWAKQESKPTYTAEEVGAMPVTIVTSSAIEGSTSLFTSGGAYALAKELNALETPYLCKVSATGSGEVDGVPQFFWYGNEGDYSCTIQFSQHEKGKVVIGGQDMYFPKVVMYAIVDGENQVVNGSPMIASDGTVTVYSNTTEDLFVLIF